MSFEWKNEWNGFITKAINELGSNLLEVAPGDFLLFSNRSFNMLSKDQLIGFYITMIRAMARRESGFNPNATYTESFKDANSKNVISRGLMQLSYESVKGYSFKLNKPEDLHDPETNLRAAVVIMNHWMGKDICISTQSGGKFYGFSKYWSVIRMGENHFKYEISKATTFYSYNLPPITNGQQSESVYDRFYAKAKTQMGIHELPGKQHEKKILAYHAETTLKASDDETPWCSSFANWVTKQCGVEGTRSAAARSWMKWGKPLDKPVKGCIVVFTRTGGGHVAFFDHQDEKYIYTLGGNQGDRVNISAYDKSRLLGFRGV